MKKSMIGTGFLVILQIVWAFAQEVTFEDNCQSLKNWQFLDAKGDGEISIIEDLSVPPEFGPKVIEMRGTNVLLFARTAKLANGTLVVLWKDVVPNQRDADGILMFRADYPEDLSELHNVKRNLPHYWIEQDFDAGFQLKYNNESDQQLTLFERSGIGLVQDQSWNQTGWIWQKVKFSGDKIYAKFWSVVSPEPEHWMLEAEHSARLTGRFGLRAWSGRARIAYFKASHEDISVPLPQMYLYADYPNSFEGQPIQFKNFFNFEKAQPDARLELKILKGKKQLSQVIFDYPVSAGFQRLLLRTEKTQTTDLPGFFLPNPLTAGEYLFQTEMKINEQIIASASRKIKIEKARDFEEQYAKLAARVKELNQDKNKLTATTARGFLNLSREKWQTRDSEAAWRALEHTKNALKRIEQPVNGYLKTRNFQMKFVDVHLSRESWQFGESDTVTIFWQITGEKPARDFSINLKLVDEYNHPIISQTAAPELPTSQWEPGQIYPQKFVLTVPHQIEPDAEQGIEMPPIFTGWHLLTVSVVDPASQYKNRPRPLLPAQPECMDFFPVGRSYTLRKLWISPEALQIQSVNLPETEAGETAKIQIRLKNNATQTLPGQLYFKLITETGETIFEHAASRELPPQGTELIEFDWRAAFAGKLKCETGILSENQVVTQMVRDWKIKWPQGIAVQFERGNQVQRERDEFQVPIRVRVTHPTGRDCPRELKLDVFTGNVVSAQESFSLDATKSVESFLVHSWPYWGYFDLKGAITGGVNFQFARRMVATVVETRDRQILVNGEPFIMKGVNVHALYSRSKRLTDQAMKILKEHGFNTIRGDYPARWQVELADKNNLAWMLLAEYSCTHTDSIAARYETEMMGSAQKITKNYLLANAGQASVLFWNSCNEIHGELDAFLLNLYPVFRQVDLCQRPVNYANLYGQDNWRGQDIMGVNYYYGIGQTALSRQPIIKNSGLIARAHGLPMIFTEYNTYWGPVEKAGVEAVAVMWAENLKDCISGGTLYQMRDDPTRHPGLLDPHGQLKIRKSMSRGLKKYFADLHLESANRDESHLQIKLTNVRPFTIRNIHVEARIRDHFEKFQLATEIAPRKSVNATLKLPAEFSNETIILDCTVTFETHFGLKNSVNRQLIFLKSREGEK